MSGSDMSPATPDEQHEVTSPSSPDSEYNSQATTPLEDPGMKRPAEIPGLRSISDSQAINPNSTALGVLGMARKPSATSSFTGAGAMENSAMAKARALQQQRMQKGMSPGASPMSPMSPMGMPGGPNGGFPGQLRMPEGLHRPGPVAHPKSAPTLSLGQRRANKLGGPGMKLSDMSGGGGSPSPGLRRMNAPKLSDMQDTPSNGEAPSNAKQGSKMDDFKKYIDAEKGWLTFDGAATITREGVNFHNGRTFSISLDEVEILDELGKGNYGTVYKAKHARPKAPRFGQGLSGLKPPLQHANSEPSSIHSHDESTSGVTMAMKEIRLELDDAKFTTILKELVILHECVSSYIIDFYGAFFQEGAVYMCIEYMDGGSIDKLYTGGIPENVLRKITYSTVMGLKSLKDEHNIIHRDVKPTNILANSKGQVKICDFGVSGNLVASIARTNIGCQSYMAPERISGGGMAQSGNSDGTYSVASDVWSLGLTIIECATGRYPYPPEVSSTIFSQLSVSIPCLM
jgi:mitogen-activated protein kinase kinase